MAALTKDLLSCTFKYINAALILGLTLLFITSGIITTRSAEGPFSIEQNLNCTDARKTDIVFIFDQSGSMDRTKRGQTYNVQVHGILRALNDPKIIPCNSSVAVTVIGFAEVAIIRVPRTEIKSAQDRESVSEIVKSQMCVSNTVQSGVCPSFGPNQGSFLNQAIRIVDQQVVKLIPAGSRLILLASIDGSLSDQQQSIEAAKALEGNAKLKGLFPELNMVLLGFDNEEESRKIVDPIVFPAPSNDLPGKTMVINPDDCNQPNQIDFIAGCSNQANQFAEFARLALWESLSPLALKVTTDADTQPGAKILSDEISLRQAIELANCRGGATTITFDEGLNGKTIRPLEPLPALSQPQITIDGRIDQNEAPGSPNVCCAVTIDGSVTDITKGEKRPDGISILSNNNKVIGLRIINFKRAGIAIDAIDSCAAVGQNRIELNKLENNSFAGVLVKNSFNTNKSSNTGNTILSNDISLPENNGIPRALIDLGSDGPTPNDFGDTDEGPNTLLNFPSSLIEIESGNLVKVEGEVDSTTEDGSIVEVFAVESFSVTPLRSQIRSIIFLKSETIAGRRFSISDLPESPTGVYAFTVTDLEGNTSELSFCDALPKADPQHSIVGFQRIEAGTSENQNPQSVTFSIKNTGCSPLELTFLSLNRKGPVIGEDESGVFRIEKVMNSDQADSLPGLSTTIKPKQIQTYRVMFDPIIPEVPLGQRPLRPADILPKKINSLITFTQKTGPEITVRLTGLITDKLRLIAPERPLLPPRVEFERSGDILTVVFYVFKPSLNIKEARYQFFDGQGKLVAVDDGIAQLKKVIDESDLVKGQSIGVLQRFSNANEHPEVARVKVIVSDTKGNTDTAEVALGSSGTSAKSVLNRKMPALVLPDLKLKAVARRLNK